MIEKVMAVLRHGHEAVQFLRGSDFDDSGEALHDSLVELAEAVAKPMNDKLEYGHAILLLFRAYEAERVGEKLRAALMVQQAEELLGLVSLLAVEPGELEYEDDEDEDD